MFPAIGSTMIAATCPRCRIDDALNRFEIVVSGQQRICGRSCRNAGAGRHAERRRTRAGLHQERIGMAVVAALELDDLVSPGRCPGDAHRTHRRFGSRAHEPHALIDGISIATLCASLVSSSVGAPKLVPREAVSASVFNRPLRRMTVNEGPHDMT